MLIEEKILTLVLKIVLSPYFIFIAGFHLRGWIEDKIRRKE